MQYFLSIDCGLTNCKAVLFDSKGQMVFEEQQHTPRKEEEIDTIALCETIIALSREVLKGSCVDPEDILAIATSGHGNGIYLIGDNGIMPYGFSSMCTKSKQYTPNTEETFPYTLQTSWSGQPLPILAYMKSEMPEVFQSIKKILFCKDLVKYILTDNICTDYTDACAAGLICCETTVYNKELLSLYGLEDSMQLLPKLHTCTDVIGQVSERFATLSGLSTKTKVVGGLFDVNACMLGAGIHEPGRYCIIAGTWGINCAVVGDAVACKEITQCSTFMYPEQYMCIDSAPTSCTNLEWFLNQVLGGISYEKASEIVGCQPQDSDLFYLPYIFKPMDLNITAGFVGLKANHTYKDMIRAVFEGIVFDHTYRIEKLKKAGIIYESAVLTGGAANSPVFRQMFADCTGLHVYTTKQSQNGALGGAIISSVAIGLYSDIPEAIREMVVMQDCCKPVDTAYYKEKYERFKQIIKGD